MSEDVVQQYILTYRLNNTEAEQFRRLFALIKRERELLEKGDKKEADRVGNEFDEDVWKTSEKVQKAIMAYLQTRS